VPSEIGFCKALKELDLSNNLIKELPREFVECSKLQTLTLNGNRLTRMQSSLVVAMANLEYLYLARNDIGEIEDLGEVGWKQAALRVVDLDRNRLASVPSSLLKDSKVHNLNLRDNLIKRSQLMKMEGLEEYQARRKQRMDIVVTNNLDVDYNICGLTS